MSLKKFLQQVCHSKLDNIPFIRQLLYEPSTELFQSINNNDDVCSIAQKYTLLLERYLQYLEQCYNDEAKRERLAMNVLLSIWKLCQLIYFSEKPYNITDLMEWQIKTYQPYLWEHDRYSIYASTVNHPDFWPFLYRLALFHQTEQICQLLSLASSQLYVKDLAPLFTEIQHVVRQPSQNGFDTVLDNLSRYQDPIANGLSTLCRLLVGNRRVAAQYASDQVQAYIVSFYYEHLATKNDGSMPLYADFEETHNAAEAFLAGNIFQALDFCTQYDGWLLTHLCILFEKKGMLDKPLYANLEQGETIQMGCLEYFKIVYAACIKNQCGLWKESFIYLLSCGKIGKEAIHEHLKLLDIEDEHRLKEVADFCIANDMKEEGLALYEKKATVCFEVQDYRKAIHYYELAENQECLDKVLRKIIQDYSATGNLIDVGIRKSYDSAYYKTYNYLLIMNEHMDNLDYTAAGDKLKELVQWVDLPQFVLPIIFQEGVKLVENKECRLDADTLLMLKKIWKLLQREEPLDPEFDTFLDTSAITLSRALDRMTE
ncbi:hypothetical protein RMCBS344292_09964 [Rhizopus microsporus]|nr:hypothetical protein RMCBS344292_09964 [Rhizopus microsporus]